MAKKIEIINSSLVVTDTNTSVVEFEIPAKIVYFRSNELNLNNLICFYSVNNKVNRLLHAILISEAVNSSGVSFSNSSFRDFARLSLGKSSASVGAEFTKTYWFDANDTATASTPITHVGNATTTYLTNNALGTETSSYNPDSKDTLWKPDTNKFDFTSLKVGDTVLFRVDLVITNLAAQEIRLLFSFAEGGSPSEEKSMSHVYYKTAATGTPVIAFYEMYIGSDNTKNFPARFRFSSPQNASIVVTGWFYKITSV
tara:strand:- start:175 stop:942 length:768 start_codon:yes stop_codon:yes gene_type:complete